MVNLPMRQPKKRGIFLVNKWIYFIIVLMLFPALLINLGLLPLIEDESIRALVALEMHISGDYVTPTLGGVLYFNKPPLFNWIIVGLYQLTNQYNEFIIRAPTIFFLLLYAYTIYRLTLRYLGKKYAFINALAFITCGRIILYDSMLGLIDVTYSWVTYLMFHAIFIFYQKQKWARLFIITWLLTAICFMLKGLPALVFTAITLLVIFSMDRNIKKLFSFYQFVGFAFFVLLVGGYYLWYEKVNPGELIAVFDSLFSESSKRTLVEHGFWESIKHIFIFPAELWYHFLPWTFLAIFLFKKESWQLIRKEPYLKYIGWVFVANILVYWLSPNVYPRYFFMLMPLAYTLLFYVFKHLSQKQGSVLVKIFEYTLLALMVVFAALQLYLPFDARTAGNGANTALAVAVFLAFAGIIICYIKKPSSRLLLFILFILIFRAEFNHVILPIREKEDWSVKCREDAIIIGQKLAGNPLKMYSEMEIEGFDGDKLLNYQTMFYLTRERMQILDRGKGKDTSTYYILFENQAGNRTFNTYYDLRIRHNKITAKVVKFSDIMPFAKQEMIAD
jgi:4-amino-4-deoxy-L-arabinose transferase-like glycosyltransferase